MSGKWTAGPWSIRPERQYDRRETRLIGANIGPDGESIRHNGDVRNGGVWVAETKGPDCDANAQLIAAAPALYEALKWFIDDIDGARTVMLEFDANVELARQALSQALGQGQT